MNLFYSILSGLLIAILLMAVLSIVYVSWRNGISPMPSSAPVRQRAVGELKRFGDASVIVEAGSGWGTLALQAARSDPRLKVIGIENSPLPLAVSRLAARWGGARNAVFRKGNLYEFPYEQADVVVCYLFPGAMKRLDPLFREKLALGACVISICFALPGWRPERVITCRDMYRTKIYVYRKDE
ncbi:class I SAM-dependent methyltransferase [Paenibacillus sp. M1]|uniref:Class I SAM-dependent methyltransferase n=1 Tax=Paenibacillus haidiansis TaxID=1574488 RepID=A0ABU7VV07_9BACL